jgi:multidrug efflux pump subunit AcrB
MIYYNQEWDISHSWFKFLKKIWNFIKGLFSKFIDLFRNYEGILKGLKDDIENLGSNKYKLDSDLISGTININGDLFKQALDRAERALNGADKIATQLKNFKDFSSVKDKKSLDSLLDTLVSPIEYKYEGDKFVDTGRLQTNLTDNVEIKTAWTAKNVVDIYPKAESVAKRLSENKKLSKDVDEVFEKAIKETEKLNPDPDKKAEGYVSPQTIASGLNKVMTLLIKVTYKETARLLAQYIKVARAFIAASKKID